MSLAPTVTLEPAGVGEQRAGLAELVEADVGQGDVLLELRRAADPPPQPLGGDEGVSIWVVPSAEITASSPDERDAFFDPAGDKVYRHPTFYDIPDDVPHM